MEDDQNLRLEITEKPSDRQSALLKLLPELKKRHMGHFDSKTSFDVLTVHSNACEKYYRLLA